MKLFTRICLLSLALVPCSLHAAPPPLRVVTLHPILTEFAREIAGEAALVEGMLQNGVDPHTFEPAPKQVAAARAADLVLATGLHLEGFLDRLVAGEGASARMIRVGERLPALLTLANEHAGHGCVHAKGEPDPHWWHSLNNALFVSDVIRAEFTQARPAEAEHFARNAQRLQQRLFALQAWGAKEISQLPPSARHLVTTHDAFGYLARDYSFTVHPLSGLSTAAEPDAKQLSALVDEVRRLRVKAVFSEDSASSRLIINLAKETGVKVPAALYADGPGPVGSGVETYEAMYRFNLSTIVAALR